MRVVLIGTTLRMVTLAGESRTVGIVYVIDDGKFYIGTGKKTWKAKHIAHNPHVSLTIPIVKQIPWLPWIKIPSATISVAGMGRVLDNNQVKPEVLHKLYRDVVKDEQAMLLSCVIEVVPRHVSKGAALEALLALPPFRGRRPIMVGDDVPDESALLAAERHGGRGLRVAGEHFGGQADFRGPHEVRVWLASIASGLRPGPESRGRTEPSPR